MGVQDIIDKTNRIEGMKNDVQKQLDDTTSRIDGEQEAVANLDGQMSKIGSEAGKLKDDITILEASMESCEEDKMTKDNQIRTLKEELAHQEDLIGKLGKEKRGAGESRQKTEEDIQAMEDKCNHLNKDQGF